MTVHDEQDTMLAALPDGLPALLAWNAAEHAEDLALSWRDGDGWASMTWAQYAGMVGRAAAGLRARGVHKGDRVAILAGNRPEHVVLDLAVLSVGAVPVSVYPTLAAEQLAHVLADSGAVLAVADAGGATKLAGLAPQVLSLEDWDAFLSEGTDTSVVAADLDAAATVIYTSGTTGLPKGVVLSQRNVLFLLESLGSVTAFQPGYVNLSYLPLAHVAERIFSHWFGLRWHGHTWFCADQADLLGTLAAARPEAFLGVPRVWEKLRAGVTAALPMPVAELPQELHEAVRAKIGLDRCSFAVSGAAPMSVDVLEFWDALGLPIHEAYGMTETTGVTNMNRPGATLFGSVGPAIPGVEQRLSDSGEVEVRGPNVMGGYLGGATRRADEWLATGDLGQLDAQGRLRIVGRSKELIVTAGGKNIAPTGFEAGLKEHPLVAHVCLVGDRRPYLVALLVLDPDELARTEVDVSAELDALLERVNARYSRAEQVKKYAVLTQDWTPESGEMTPTLKLRRSVIHQLHADVIESLYA